VEKNTERGGCFCGNIRYAFDSGQYRIANCHCEMCRRTSAAPFVTWVVVPKSNFAFTKGVAKKLQSSEHGTRYFCADCGTPLIFYTRQRPQDWDVTSCSLDEPELFVPTIAVHEESKLGWLKETE